MDLSRLCESKSKFTYPLRREVFLHPGIHNMNPDNLPTCLLPVVRSGLDPGVLPDQVFAGTPVLPPFRDPKDKVRDRPR